MEPIHNEQRLLRQDHFTINQSRRWISRQHRRHVNEKQTERSDEVVDSLEDESVDLKDLDNVILRAQGHETAMPRSFSAHAALGLGYRCVHFDSDNDLGTTLQLISVQHFGVLGRVHYFLLPE